MREFFRGWKRKLGVVTLVMALAFLGGWVRSMSVVDLLDYKRDARTAYFVHSADKKLLFVWLHDNPHPFLSTIGSVPLSDSTDIRLISIFRNSGWNCFGFAIGDTKNNTDDSTTNIAFCLVPYWSLTIPLTLISLWLLLTKPRKSTPMKITRPAPKEGT